MSITRICPSCTHPFEVPAKHKNAQFCSNACKGVARRRSVTLECQGCHQPFTVRAYRQETAQFCSKVCKYVAMRLPEETGICPQCGEEFILSVRQQSNTGDRFCSRKCATIYTSRDKRWKALRDFWTRVQRCDHEEWCPYCCMPWTGTLDLNGYGKIIVDKKQIYTHRAAYELCNGCSLSPETKVAHYCHYTSCCNPWHIHSGTQKDNLDDSIRDKRHSFGERNGHSKMTEQTAIEVLAKYAEGWPIIKIVTIMDLPYPATQALCSGRSWKHLPRPTMVIEKERAPGPHQLFLIP